MSDADKVGQLLHDFNTEFETPSPGARVLGDRLRTLLAGGSVFAIIAGEPAVAVALFTVRPSVWYEGGIALLDELYVVPEHRNQGIGSAIVDLLHRHVRASRIEAIEINVDEADIDAQRFYERHHYSPVDPDTNERAFYYFQEFSPTE